MPLVTQDEPSLVAFDASPTDLDAPVDDAGSVDPCLETLDAAPPSGTSRTLNQIVLAVYRWRFDQADDTPTTDDLCGSPGFDLDNKDTHGDCANGGTCAPRIGKGVCDLRRGVDDSLSGILDMLRALSARPLLDPNVLLRSATAGLIFKIDNYNGEANDEDVQLTIFVAAGLSGLVPDAGAGQVFSINDVDRLPQVWDGGPVDSGWIVDERSYTTTRDGGGLGVPTDTTADAFVRDYVLYARLHDGIFPIGVPGANTRYRAGELIAKLVPGERGVRPWKLTRGRIGVRSSSSALLTSLGAAHTPTSGTGQLCDPTNEGTYGQLRALACGSLDLTPGDNGAPCDELSAAFTFAAVETMMTVDPDSPSRYPTMPSVFGASLPCAEGGTIACDDCAWDAPKRCAFDGDGATD